VSCVRLIVVGAIVIAGVGLVAHFAVAQVGGVVHHVLAIKVVVVVPRAIRAAR